MIKKIFLLLLIPALNTVFAQQTVNEILIREKRLSDKTAFHKNATVQIISAEDIKRINAQSLSDVLHFVLGVQASNRGMDNAQTDIKMNGGTFEQTMIMINGHPVTDAQTGHHLMNLPIHINDVHHIEIIAGPRAHSYGINGTSGSINIVTKQGIENEVNVSAFAGSSFQHDTSGNDIFANGGLHVGISHHRKYANHYLSVSALKSSGFMYNTAVNNRRIFYSTALDLPRDHEINMQAAYISNAFGANGFYASPFDREATEKVNTLWVSADHEKGLGEKWKIRSNFSLRRNTDDYIFIKANPAYYHNMHKTLSANANINTIYRYHSGEFATGVSCNYQQIRSSNLGNNERFNHGLFAENNLVISKFNARFGLYGNYNSVWGLSVLPGIDIGYALHQKITIFAGAGSANRIPTYTDLYYKGPSNTGNDQLIPEKSIGADLGIKYQSVHCELSAGAFHNRVSNFIDWTKEKGTSVWQPSNFGAHNVQGLLFISTFNFDKDDDLFIKAFSAKYQFINTGFTNTVAHTESKYVLDYFRHQAIVSATVSAFEHFFVTLNGRYQYRFNYHDYTILDIRLAYASEKLNVFADINNLLNTQYHESNAQAMPSRWLSIGLSCKFF